MIKKLALALVLLILLVLLAAGWQFKSLQKPTGKKAHWQIFAVIPGEKIADLAARLESAGLIAGNKRTALVLAARLTGKSRHLQVGRYQLSPSQPPWEILEWIEKGKVYTFRVTIPEGFTLQQIGELLEAQGIGKAAEFIELATAQADSFKTRFPRPGSSLEGYLFPDTYEIDGRQGMRDIIDKMLHRFDEVVWQGLLGGKPRSAGLSLHQVLTLASLVEGEARKADERALIAGVLMNRLQNSMLLQCDATVQYALGKRHARLTYDDLKVDSRYNTYKYSGLPPGPIDNPGKASIVAALAPQQSPFLFYVARGDGSHVFSRTFTEHQAAIIRIHQANGG
jgi:UPF0755 protein